MVSRDKIQIDLIKLVSGERLLRLTEAAVRLGAGKEARSKTAGCSPKGAAFQRV